jgi:hypothetical protein
MIFDVPFGSEMLSVCCLCAKINHLQYLYCSTLLTRMLTTDIARASLSLTLSLSLSPPLSLSDSLTLCPQVGHHGLARACMRVQVRLTSTCSLATHLLITI